VFEAKDDGDGGDNWTIGAISHAELLSNHHRQQTNIQAVTETQNNYWKRTSLSMAICIY